jgi:hypothetical protein
MADSRVYDRGNAQIKVNGVLGLPRKALAFLGSFFGFSIAISAQPAAGCGGKSILLPFVVNFMPVRWLLGKS